MSVKYFLLFFLILFSISSCRAHREVRPNDNLVPHKPDKTIQKNMRNPSPSSNKNKQVVKQNQGYCINIEESLRALTNTNILIADGYENLGKALFVEEELSDFRNKINSYITSVENDNNGLKHVHPNSFCEKIQIGIQSKDEKIVNEVTNSWLADSKAKLNTFARNLPVTKVIGCDKHAKTMLDVLIKKDKIENSSFALIKRLYGECLTRNSHQGNIKF